MESRRQPYPRQSRPRRDDQLDRRLDQWLETGRQLVDGVAGTRPGRRSGVAGRAGRSSGASLDAVGRWVGDKIDWLLDEEDDWREPWEPEPAARTVRDRSSARVDAIAGDSRAVSTGGKRRLQAISRRQPPLIAAANEPAVVTPPGATTSSVSSGRPVQNSDDAWPDDDSFRVERWQRSQARVQSQPSPAASDAVASPSSPQRPVAGRRALPRSSRRRS
jgi:hypothetical protein